MAMMRSFAEKLAELEGDLSKVKADIAKVKELLEKKFKCSIEELRLKWDCKEETNPAVGVQLARLDELENDKRLLEKKEVLLMEEKRDLRSAAAAAGKSQRTISVEGWRA